MKICISINTFKEEKNFLPHEKMCVESLRKLKKQFNCIELISLSFEDESILLDDFKCLNILKNSSKDQFPNVKKRLPFLNEIFDTLSCLDYNYFLFVNNDIIVSDRFIKQILNSPEYETFVASKLHFSKLDSLDDKAPIPDAISVHGFDGFAIKNTWWSQNSNKFEKFFLGKPYWDTYFSTMCYLHSKCKVLNKPPLSIFHVAHNSDAMLEDEATAFNVESFKKDPNIGRIWFNYVYSILLKRPTTNNIKWFTPFENEELYEQQFLKL